MKLTSRPELPRFIMGALATAGASMANGATVQITFANNFVANASTGGLTSFNGDLTGDMIADIVGRSFAFRADIRVLGGGAILGLAYYSGGNSSFVASVGGGVLNLPGPATLQAVASFNFSDTNVNGGAVTNGWLDLTASASPSGYKVQVNRLIFDDTSVTAPTGVTLSSPTFTEWQAIPEPSSLGLLALGAGGLLARRRREKTSA